MKLKSILQVFALFLFPFLINAQVTTSSMGGFVKSSTGEALQGATITATHEPTGTVYRVISKAGGKFDINNMNPGGPYNISVSFVNFATFKRDEVYLTLGESSKQDFALSSKATELATVVVSSTRQTQGRGGTETTIGRDRIANMPSVGRNITDFLRAVPQAKLTTTEGAISVAGQNNRYNAFYIDGALNNDVFGLAASGTNGGQANIAPISIDAIDQVQVVISPYDASLSGFTGGGINAITRSGTNTLTGSVYYLYRNEQLTGKTPTGNKELATRLGKFENKTYGFRIGGPVIKNKLFFFVNAELQRDARPQPFDTSLYKGNTRPGVILGLADTLRRKYNYDPGEIINNPEKVNATRITAKIDWNLNEKNKLSLSYRYNFGERYNISTSTSSTINFYNDGYIFPTTAHYVSAELRSNFNRGNSNRLLLTYGDIMDNRGVIGSPFPRVSITDGSGTIIFGPDNSSTINLLTQKNYNLLDIFRFNIGRHSMSVGTDDELNNDYNAFIQNTYGNYAYNSFADFLNNAKPKSYSVGYPLIDNKLDETTAAAAKFKTLRLGAFINDEYRPNESLTLNFGIRADKFSFLTQPATDTFTNNTALPVFENYYDLKGARSGQKPSFDIAISPRVGFTYRIKEENVTIRGGAGYFTGRIPLVWPGGVYNNNGINQGGFTSSSSQNAFALDTIRFKPDPNGQYRAADVGIKLTKGPLNLISKNFKLPKVFRMSFGFDKQLGSGWTATTELLFSKNINETYYTNINIRPPAGVSVGPGSRNVYPSPNTLPINANGTSPYDNAILLSNAPGSKGFSYDVTFMIDKRFQSGLSFNLSYTYGNAVVVHEPTSSVNFSQWRFVETVNGRNYIDRSISDFSKDHRIFGYISKKLTYLHKILATTFTLVYNGQSGAPFSYVYGTNSAIRDDANTAVSNDLVYIPTSSDIQQAVFLNNTIGSGSSAVTYTPQQQKDALESYIQSNSYLGKHRGEFADRNGARLPFQHVIDFRVAQDFNINVGNKRLQFQLTYDVFNFTNMLNRKWGRTYFLSNDQFRFLEFQGYVSATDLTPQYKFNPTLTQPNSITNINTSTAPSFSPRWTSQLGLRFNF